MVKKPWLARTLPNPWQDGHVTGLEPASAPVPLQDFAGHRGGNPDLRSFAREGLGERDFHIVFEIGAALLGAAPARAPAAHELAEQVVENLRHGCREIGAEAVAGTVRTRALKGRMAELIVSRPFLRVFQSLVGLVDFLKVDLGCVVSGIPVGVKLLREPPESALDLVIGCPLFQSEHFVVIALHGLFLRSRVIRASSPKDPLRLPRRK